MKEFDTWEAMQMAFEYYEKDTITVGELNLWCEKYMDEYPEMYVRICSDDIHYEHDCGRIYWEIVHQQSDLIHKQESIQCTTCGTRHYKYPNVELYEKISEMLGQMKKLEELWKLK